MSNAYPIQASHECSNINRQTQNVTGTATNVFDRGKQIKSGYLLRYQRSWLWKIWKKEWIVLYEDSTIAWFKDMNESIPYGYLRIKNFPELIPVNEWISQIRCRPQLPSNCKSSQLISINTRQQNGKSLMLSAESQHEINDWITTIKNTLLYPNKCLNETDKSETYAICPKNAAQYNKNISSTKQQQYHSSPFIIDQKMDVLINHPVTNNMKIPIQTAPTNMIQEKKIHPNGLRSLTKDHIVPVPNNNRMSRRITNNKYNKDDYASGVMMGGAYFNWGHGLPHATHGSEDCSNYGDLNMDCAMDFAC